ncbi:MAG: hypothetical protein OSA98_05220 [Rubripirellula sp.]|nr:hypothetical protein [Rubripirellula sp.]
MRISASLLLCFCFFAFSLNGCGGGGEPIVIEAPAADAEDAAMEGISDDDYNKAMEESMNEQGN